MAATGYTPISLYYSTTAAATPSASNLTNGELAINITDGKLFYKDNAGVVQTLVSKNATVTSFSAGTTGLTPSTATSGAVTLAGTLNLANGGTGSTTAAGARTNLGATTAGSNLFTLTNPSAITFLRVNADNTVSALDAATYRTAIGATTLGGNMFTLTNPSAITFPRFNADNTVSALDAATYRTAIGGTTVGQNFYTLANPSAITFIRVNADNTVSTLDAASFRTAIGAGTGGGSVSSVSGTGTVNGITLTGTVTTTGSLTLGGTLSGVSLTTQVTGTLPIANGGTGATTATQAYAALRGFTTTVSSASVITLTVSSATQQEITGSTAQTITLPVTTTLATGWAVEIINNSTANVTVNSSGGNLVGTVIPGTTAHCVCALASGTTAASWDFDFSGFSTITGTGANVMATSPTLVTPALGTPTSGTLTSCTGLPLTTGVTGTLGVANGGTGATSLTANNVILGNGTSAVQVVAPGTSGNVLTSNGTTWVSQAAGGDPIGTFKEFAGATTTTYPGSSWLRCSGGIVSQSTYSGLYAKVGLLANTFSYGGIHNTGITSTATYATYGDGLWLVGTQAGPAYTSTDASKWTVAPTANNISVASYGATNVWVGAQGVNFYTATTPTGTWTNTYAGSFAITSVAYNSAAASYKYANAAGTALYTSTNAVTWTARSPAATLVYAFNGIFFAWYTTSLSTSTDGVTFTARTSNLAGSVAGMAYGSNQTNKYVAVGASGSISTSTDGITWTARTSNTASNIVSVVYNGTQYQYMDSNSAGVGTSTDGVTWTYLGGNILNYYATKTAASNGSLIVVGRDTSNNAQSIISYQDPYSSAIAGPFVYDDASNTLLGTCQYGSTNAVATSTNEAITWASRTGSSTTLPVNALVYGSGLTNKYVMLGGNTGVPLLKTSTDLVTWTNRTAAASTNQFSSGTSSGSLYVAGCYATSTYPTQLQTSTDGVTWTARTTNLPNAGANASYNINNVTYNPDGPYKFIFTADVNSGSPSFTNTYYYNTSTDGITWGTPTAVASSYSSLVYGNGVYMVGQPLGVILTSLDAVTWTTVSNGVTGAGNNTIYNLSYGNGLFVYGTGNTTTVGYSFSNGATWKTITATGSGYNNNTMFNSKNTLGWQVYNVGGLAGTTKFSYNSSTDFALPLQTDALTQPAADKLYIKAL